MNDPNAALRKAAILIDCLDPQSADALLDQMTAERAAQVRNEVMRLGEVGMSERERIIDEFLSGQRPPAHEDDGGIELDDSLAEKLATSHFPPPQDRHVENAPADKPPFRFLHEAAADTLIPVLKYEHPQTVAVIISHLTPQRAADLIGRLPEKLQADVLRRVVELNDTDSEIIAEIEQEIESLLSEQMHTVKRRSAGLAAASAILAAADYHDRQAILTNVGRRDRELAERLAGEDGQRGATCNVPPRDEAVPPIPAVERDDSHSGCFEDVVNLDDRSLAMLLNAAEPQLAILALTGAPHSFVQRILRQLPARQAKALQRQMEQTGPIRLRDIEHAQQYVARLAAQLTAQDQIHSSPAPRFAAAA